MKNLNSSNAVALISHSHAQRPSPSYAKDLYISDYFRLKKELCELYGFHYEILSPRYGIINTIETIEPYDWTKWKFIEKWQPWINGIEIISEFYKPEYLLILAGDHYARAMYWALEVSRVPSMTLVVPMRGLRIGEKKKWLKDKINEILQDESKRNG